jgi:hypothetical protein
VCAVAAAIAYCDHFAQARFAGHYSNIEVFCPGAFQSTGIGSLLNQISSVRPIISPLRGQQRPSDVLPELHKGFARSMSQRFTWGSMIATKPWPG